jgi:hypothetical protein
MMFGNPKQIFKMLRVAGVRVKFDCEQRALIIVTDSGQQAHKFDDIEKMVNGDDEQRGETY